MLKACVMKMKKPWADFSRCELWGNAALRDTGLLVGDEMVAISFWRDV